MIDPKLRAWIIRIVTGVWAVNFVASIMPWIDYQSDQAINAIFMAVVGGLFALGARKKDDNSDSGDGA